uniref:Flagellar Assembly Protein A N-terminal region domain-containing protein n=1 Tax=uncultured bacterium contig00069 TaxID=1181550 RepID=A0A806JZM7_9BACT|nr:protein of unknown function DUF342 [uncultured bacterium contig00069]
MSGEIKNDEKTGASKKEVKVHRFKIAVSKDQMELKMYPLIEVTDGALTTFEDVIDACKRENIKVELDERAIERQLLDANPVEITIAKGIRPRDGENGYIEFLVDMSAKPQFIAAAETSSVDYKNSMQVTLVNSGDILANIIPPTNGEPGRDVRGNEIQAMPGAKARYFLAEGVEEKDNKIVVTAAGTPSVQDDCIMIRRNYVLQNDVDLSTGNINFPGTVIIHGNVTDGFEVVSEENVVINGLISGAKVIAKGYVKCAGGIQGKGKAEVTAGSFVAATFVSAAKIIAEGDVVITKDILHSNISCLGELRLGGSIIGGVATAFKGVECFNLGSETGVKTIVNIRTHYRQEKAKELANSVMEEVNAIFERYRIWNKAESINEEESKMLLKDIAALQGLISKRQMFDSRAAKFDQMIFENKTARVKLLGILEADVTIASPISRYNSISHMKGPLMISENNSSGKMAISKGA